MQKFTHMHASEYMIDTETTVSVGSDFVTVTVKLVPGLRYWSAPDAKTIRKWVDEALEGTGRKRLGARFDNSQYTASGWRYLYPLD